MDHILKKHERKVNSINKTIKKRTKINNDCNKDILKLHQEKMEYFQKLQNSLPKKKEELKSEKQVYNRQNLTTQIYEIETRQEETCYFFKVSKIISDYINTTDEEEKEKLAIQYYTACGLKYNLNKSSQDYKKSIYYCKECDDYEKYETEEGIVCIKCGIVSGVCIDILPTYDEICEGKGIISKKIMYSRENYFIDLLKKIQSTNNKNVPKELINLIKSELYVLNIKESHQVTIPLIRKILKKLNYSNHYNDVQYIISTINNQKTLVIPKSVEDILIHMFEVIQEPWEFHVKNQQRSNFFSYPYVLYKFFQILNLNEYLPFLTLLKKEKLIQHENLWKKIMDHINEYDLDKRYPFKIDWRFIPI